MWGKRYPQSGLMGLQTCAATMEIGVGIPQNPINRTRYTSLEHIPETIYIRLQRYLVINIHSSF